MKGEIPGCVGEANSYILLGVVTGEISMQGGA